ncbi:MAG: hypothetical protein ACREI2_00310 [Nitrospiraceae bacterium]
MKKVCCLVMAGVIAGILLWTTTAQAEQAAASRILIHMKTSLAEDDAQICAVPNVAWAAVKAGHKVKILVDASAVTSVTKGFGWFNGIFRRDSTALDRAALPERERQSLSEQMGVEIYGNRTMMLLYNIDPARTASSVTPIPLERMVQLFREADRVIVY